MRFFSSNLGLVWFDLVVYQIPTFYYVGNWSKSLVWWWWWVVVGGGGGGGDGGGGGGGGGGRRAGISLTVLGEGCTVLVQPRWNHPRQVVGEHVFANMFSI